MKKEKRQIYRDILSIGGYGLCHVCHYAAWYGYSCCDATMDCDHPLPVVNGEVYSDPGRVYEGHDCWGFRKKKGMTLSDIAAMSSIAADGNQPHRNKRGEWVALTGVDI